MGKSASFAILATMMAATGNYNYRNRTEEILNSSKDFEEKPQPGQFDYWFRKDGTFLSSRNEERMLTEDVFYECFAINDKTAIKKFDKHISSIQESNV